MSLLNSMKKEMNYSYTENRALTNNSTLNANLDLFFKGGSSRHLSESELRTFFYDAFIEDKFLFIKNIFYLRDVREGAGERRVFREALRFLFKEDKSLLFFVLPSIPEYGRWDDLLFLVNENDKDLNQAILKIISPILECDLEKDMDLNQLTLFKWMYSQNTSSKETKRLATKLMSLLRMTPKSYRLMLSRGRKKLNLVEQKMSLNKFNEIKYSEVPSKAMYKYRKAFSKKDTDRFKEYITEVKQGTAKINATNNFPYEIIRHYLNENLDETESETLEVLWKNLSKSEYDESAIVVADVSGSMEGTPLEVAISLALFFSERNKNENFKEHFITFSSNPQLVKIKGNSLMEKVNSIKKADWNMNTDIQKVFKLILSTAKKYKLTDVDIPKTIYIVSDMEFDVATIGNTATNYEEIRDKFEENGFSLPKLVFWNVNSRQTGNSPICANDFGLLVSGFSQKIFDMVSKSKVSSPEDFMRSILNSERYDRLIS